MDEIRKKAEERAANPSRAPVGSSFETDRQREKAVRVRPNNQTYGSKVRKISAVSESFDESNKQLRQGPLQQKIFYTLLMTTISTILPTSLQTVLTTVAVTTEPQTQ